MLKEHAFYVYHEENRVMARKANLPPVIAEECLTPQAAHDRVQTIVNPHGFKPDDSTFEGMGFNHPGFQATISESCRAFVEAAYSANA